MGFSVVVWAVSIRIRRSPTNRVCSRCMPNLTLEEIARRMDPASPPGDLEALVRRHRWIGAPPAGQGAEQEILRRHNHPDTRTHRFLHFNTFLVPGVQLGLGLNGAARLALVLAQFGLFAGRSMARLRPRDLWAELRPRGAALREFAEGRLSPLLGRLDPGAAGDRTLDLMASLGRRVRAVEAARMVAREYDLAALCEVFTKTTRDRMLQEAGKQRPIKHAAGPSAGPGVGRVGSGLLGLCMEQAGARRLLRAAWRPFSRHGDPMRDGDAWATKGVLLLEVALGPGKLELYSTHLLWGNDLLASDRRLLRLAAPRLQPDRLLDLRLSQVDDLLAFYREQHEPGNMALVAGDFNLRAHEPEQYAALTERMATVNMRDAWPYPGRVRPAPGGETVCTSASGRISRLERLGPMDAEGYLDDRRETPRGQGRVDYLFAQDPAPEHTFNLDLTRIRRRAFPRAAHDARDQRFLSDHVGLDTTLVASPIA